MRRIDIASLELAKGQSGALAAATEGVNDAADRKKYIDDHAHCWRAMRDAFEVVSRYKCWYCETNRKRADFAVDHFRPKNSVAECAVHAGYWWLAFEISNYRLSCTYCNERRVNSETRGGKADHFPLIDESARCMAPGDNLEQEEPELLDPVSEGDAELLRFESDGDVNPRYDVGLDEVAYRRATKSIELYHLRDPLLRRARADTIRKVFAHLSAAQDLKRRGGNHLRSYKRLVTEMRGSISDSGEYSAAVNDVLGNLIKPFFRDVECA